MWRYLSCCFSFLWKEDQPELDIEMTGLQRRGAHSLAKQHDVLQTSANGRWAGAQSKQQPAHAHNVPPEADVDKALRLPADFELSSAVYDDDFLFTPLHYLALGRCDPTAYAGARTHYPLTLAHARGEGVPSGDSEEGRLEVLTLLAGKGFLDLSQSLFAGAYFFLCV